MSARRRSSREDTRIEATPLAIPLAQEFHWAGGSQVGREPRPLLGAHRRGRRRLRRVGLRGAGGGRAYGQLMARPADRALARRRRGDPALDLDARAAGRRPRSSRSSSSPGIETACWDALGRTLGVPTRTFFGGQVQEELDYFGFLQGDDADDARRARARARAEGYEVIYLKVGPRSRARRRDRRGRPRGDRPGQAAAHRPERGVGRRRPRSSGSGCSSRTTSTGSSSRRRAGDIDGLAHVRRRST